MPYGAFAYWYDILNSEADYDTLATWLQDTLRAHHIQEGIVADLGCGTGEISLRLAQAGYDMIAIDKSYDMLAVFREKLYTANSPDILLLQQDLSQLDLYGTIRAGVSTFDTFNHLPQTMLQKALARISLFMEPGGLLLFDANTPYKHEAVLADREFRIESDENTTCVWNNRFNPVTHATEIRVTVLQHGKELFNENFMEYAYTLEAWHSMLEQAGYRVEQVLDGEHFAPLNKESQRYLFTAIKEG